MKKNKEEWDQFSNSIVQANYPISAINEIGSFRRRFEGHEDYNDIDFKCTSLSSLVYYMNDLVEQSLETDLKSLTVNSLDHPQYYLHVLSAIQTSAELKRTDEVMPYVVNFLKTPNDNFQAKIPALVSYIKYYPEGENGFFIGLERTLSNVISKMGVEIDHSLSFTARVNLLNNELTRANRELGFLIALILLYMEQRLNVC